MSASGPIEGSPFDELPMLPEHLDMHEPTLRVLEHIDGKKIERDLLDLAKVGGIAIEPTLELPERYAVHRLALSESDKLARNIFIEPWMDHEGMEIYRHPLAIIGVLKGSEPGLAPVAILSHTDSVANGDIYDGSLGVVGGLHTVRAMNAAGVVPRRDLMVISLTGEESAAFNLALFGSRSIFHGLTEEELESRSNAGQSIREALASGLKEIIVSEPIFSSGWEAEKLEQPMAAIELHVEQADSLANQGLDIGIVESIAAPRRFEITVGDSPLEPDTTNYPYERFLKLTVNGVADHSGATPMGKNHRTDGLVETAECLLPFLRPSGSSDFTIANLEIEAQGMNKIPGRTHTLIRLTGSSEAEVSSTQHLLEAHISTRNSANPNASIKLGSDFVTLEQAELRGTVYRSEEINPRIRAALKIVRAVNRQAEDYGAQTVVGTVGVFDIENGVCKLKADIRGLKSQPRDEAIANIMSEINELTGPAVHSRQLVGSGDPTDSSPFLIEQAARSIEEFNIGTYRTMNSAAGHDIQNAARAGIRSLLLFVPSRNDGAAHNPDAYSTPADLEKGVKALAALAVRLTA